MLQCSQLTSRIPGALLLFIEVVACFFCTQISPLSQENRTQAFQLHSCCSCTMFLEKGVPYFTIFYNCFRIAIVSLKSCYSVFNLVIQPLVVMRSLAELGSDFLTGK